jgi:hypothetical protein
MDVDEENYFNTSDDEDDNATESTIAQATALENDEESSFTNTSSSASISESTTYIFISIECRVPCKAISSGVESSQKVTFSDIELTKQCRFFLHRFSPSTSVEFLGYCGFWC